jgi:preprotein translocase subunit SecD
MHNRYPLWKYLILIVALAAGALYALPNVYGEDPAIQISSRAGGPPAETVQQRILDLLEQEELAVKSSEATEEHFLIRMQDTTAQLEAADEIGLALGTDYMVALNLAPVTP